MVLERHKDTGHIVTKTYVKIYVPYHNLDELVRDGVTRVVTRDGTVIELESWNDGAEC